MPKLPISKGALDKIGLGSTMGVIGAGMDAYFAMGDAKTAMEKGSSRLGATVQGVGNFALYQSLGFWPTLAMQALPAIPSMAVEGYESLGKLTRQMNQQSKQVPFVNSTFNDYSQAFTMRQAGMQIAQASRYNLQQTLMGNEAAYLKGR